MTAQNPEILIHDGVRRPMYACPLEGYLARLPKARRPRFIVESTANWRGYIGTWTFIDRVLHLVQIEGVFSAPGEVCIQDSSIAACFPWRSGPLPARWYTGAPRCPEGRLRQYYHVGFMSIYEREREFHIARGVLESQLLRYVPPAPLEYWIEAGKPRRYCGGEGEPDPCPADEPVDPYRVWGNPDWDICEFQFDS